MVWKIDSAHSEVQFKVKHLVITTVTGTFEKFEGILDTKSETNFDGAEIKFELDVDSVNTKQKDRDNHLKSVDFFDVTNFPKITFSEGKLHSLSDDEYTLNGILTIKNISKPVSLKTNYNGTMKDPWGNVKCGFEVKGKINRKEFGMTWNAPLEAGGVLVGEEIILDINVQLIQS